MDHQKCVLPLKNPFCNNVVEKVGGNGFFHYAMSIIKEILQSFRVLIKNNPKGFNWNTGNQSFL